MKRNTEGQSGPEEVDGRTWRSVEHVEEESVAAELNNDMSLRAVARALGRGVSTLRDQPRGA